jgi:hypothetical protein
MNILYESRLKIDANKLHILDLDYVALEAKSDFFMGNLTKFSASGFYSVGW